MRHHLSVVLVGALVMVGCGGGDDGNGHLPDGPPGPTDAAVDAPVDAPDQPLPPVTLTITRNGAPVAGVHTYFLNADSSVVATLDTDASGTVTARMAAGGSVTAIDPFPDVATSRVTATAVILGNNDLRTFMGVKPGDHLVLTQDAPGTPIAFTLNAKALPSANTYDVVTTCGLDSLSPGQGGGGSGSPDPGGVVHLTGCHGFADILIIASEFNNENNPILGAQYHADVGLTEGETVVLTDTDYPALADFTYSYMNAPANAGTISVDHTLATGRGRFARSFGGGTSPDDSGAATITFQEPTVPGTVAITDTTVRMRGQHHVIDRGAVAATYTLDMAGLLLPDLLGQRFYNPTTGRLEWVEDTIGVKPDLTITSINVSQGERTWHWTVAAPYTAGQLKFPTLPTDVADWAPGPDDGVNVTTLRNAKVPGGYDAVRAHIHDVAGDGGIAGATGRVITVELQLLEAGRQRRAHLRSGR
jgi:hypothetical protein